MYTQTHPKIMRFFTAIVIAALFVALIPQAVFAAGVPSLTITEIISGVSVSVHGSNFPQNVEFTARMDVMGNYAIGGTVVGSFNSGTGSFDATFNVPASLKTAGTIALRVDGTGGWYSYNAFVNNSSSVVVSPTIPSNTTLKNYVEVIGVKADDMILVQARNFPAKQTFQIRIGTFKNFSKDFVVAGNISSGLGGSFQFTVDLPPMQKDADLFTIRLDSPQKSYSYNVFKNVTSGSVVPGSSPTPTPVSGTCLVVSTQPTRTLALREDFDGVWTIKNTSASNWELSEVDYKYISGTQMQNNGSTFDLGVTVKPGESVTIIVDMTAPATAGKYATNWALMKGSTTLCALPLSVTVK